MQDEKQKDVEDDEEDEEDDGDISKYKLDSDVSNISVA